MNSLGSIANTNAIDLQNIDDGVAPVSRIRDVTAARGIVDAVIYANRERNRVNTAVQGMVDGNPPISRAKLRENGQAWRYSVNFMEGKAITSAALVPYYDLFAGNKYYFEVRTKEGTLLTQEVWSNYITEAFDWLLKGWSGFDFNMQAMLQNMVLFGKGFLMWMDKTEWQFKFVSQFKVLVPNGTDGYSEDLEITVLRQSYRVDQLWKYLRNAGAAIDAGWNREAVLTSIANATPDFAMSTSAGQWNYDKVQQMMRDHDISQGVRCATVQASHILVKEFSGKVSHYILDEKGVGPNTGQQKGVNDFLFKSVGRFDSFASILATFFLETLDGSWNGAAGLGNQIYAPIEAKNRLRCAELDAAHLRSGITLQAKTPSATQKTALVQIGAFNIIPDGYDVQQSTIMGDIQGLIAVQRDLDQLIQANTGVYRQRMEQRQGNPRTAEEVRLEYQSSATLSNSAISRFYGNLDRFGAELFNRARNDPEFQKRCREKGVPKEAWENVLYVRAFRTLGNGSMFMRQQVYSTTKELVPMLPEKGRNAWLTEAIAATAGQDAAERWNPQPNPSELPDDQVAIATGQVADMKIGVPAVVTSTQNPVIFASVFLDAAEQSLQSLDQGGNPAEVLAFMPLVLHAIVSHLQRMQMDPSRKAAYDQLEQRFQAVAKATDKLQGHMEQAHQQAMQDHQQAQQQAQGDDPQTQALIATTQTKIGLDTQKAQHAMQLKDAKQAHAAQLKELAQQHAMALATQKQQFDEALKAQQARAQNALAARE